VANLAWAFVTPPNQPLVPPEDGIAEVAWDYRDLAGCSTWISMRSEVARGVRKYFITIEECQFEIRGLIPTLLEATEVVCLRVYSFITRTFQTLLILNS